MAFSDQSLFHYALLAFFLIGPPPSSPSGSFKPHMASIIALAGALLSPLLWPGSSWKPHSLAYLLLFPVGQHATNSKALILMSPFIIHYFHRTCLYPLRLYLSTTQRNTKSGTGFPGFDGVKEREWWVQGTKRRVFELVSCPNYFGEIVEWLGWSVMTWSWVGFGFFLYTCANLMPRAFANHKWYLDKFGEDYPRARKAVIPFLY
ncbi:hypothetical protein GH714_008589 [Hevea brasiliensis]|uniref:3-oxo-5-alpha-steroid 4-dehydrogenase C-terminal domain-containing protein n=1 Tax=Hevea brasiliensis TaxID=3981 RepID=A0A6A6KI18_HEVBR|nr:hypothetical protein GH714_008589 [Hevea brasiliensis]